MNIRETRLRGFINWHTLRSVTDAQHVADQLASYNLNSTRVMCVHGPGWGYSPINPWRSDASPNQRYYDHVLRVSDALLERGVMPFFDLTQGHDSEAAYYARFVPFSQRFDALHGFWRSHFNKMVRTLEPLSPSVGLGINNEKTPLEFLRDANQFLRGSGLPVTGNVGVGTPLRPAELFSATGILWPASSVEAAAHDSMPSHINTVIDDDHLKGPLSWFSGTGHRRLWNAAWDNGASVLWQIWAVGDGANGTRDMRLRPDIHRRNWNHPRNPSRLDGLYALAALDGGVVVPPPPVEVPRGGRNFVLAVREAAGLPPVNRHTLDRLASGPEFVRTYNQFVKAVGRKKKKKKK